MEESINRNLLHQEMQNIMAKWMTWIDKLVRPAVTWRSEPLPGRISARKNKVVTDAIVRRAKRDHRRLFHHQHAPITEAVALCNDTDFWLGGSVIVHDCRRWICHHVFITSLPRTPLPGERAEVRFLIDTRNNCTGSFSAHETNG